MIRCHIAGRSRGNVDYYDGRYYDGRNHVRNKSLNDGRSHLIFPEKSYVEHGHGAVQSIDRGGIRRTLQGDLRVRLRLLEDGDVSFSRCRVSISFTFRNEVSIMAISKRRAMDPEHRDGGVTSIRGSKSFSYTAREKHGVIHRLRPPITRARWNVSREAFT